MKYYVNANGKTLMGMLNNLKAKEARANKGLFGWSIEKNSAGARTRDATDAREVE